MELIDRYRGAMVGLAVGDALGAPAEFKLPGTFPLIDSMIGGGLFGLQPGQWTDDTSMALCLAESLIDCRGFDAVDQLRRYDKWYREGHLSATGECFDIGMNVQAALLRFEATGEPHCGSTDPMSAGNGCLMRLAPVPMAFSMNPVKAIELSAESARTTHGAVAAIDACRYLGGLIVGALKGATKDELLSPFYSPLPGYWEQHKLSAEVADVASGSFLRKSPPAIQGSGYCVRSLEAALWAFAHASDFRGGAIAAINLGDDADTTGAIFGQLAGAHYGLKAIPHEWRMPLAHRDLIQRFADGLHSLATHPRFNETGMASA